MDRIAGELRVQLDGNYELEIREAIEQAIEFHTDERLWFLEDSVASATVANQANYDLPSDVLEIDELTVTLNDNTYPLAELPWQQYTVLQSNPAHTGQPWRYARHSNDLWFYPIPDAIYTYTIWYRKRRPELDEPTDTNDWITYGQALLIADVCQRMAPRVQMQPLDRQHYRAMAEEELRKLRRKSRGKAVHDYIWPRAF